MANVLTLFHFEFPQMFTWLAYASTEERPGRERRGRGHTIFGFVQGAESTGRRVDGARQLGAGGEVVTALRDVRGLGVAALLLNLADAYTTRLGMQLGAVEANPATAWLVATLGVTGGLTAKAVVTAGALGVLYRRAVKALRARLALAALVVAFTLVVLNNLWVMRRLGGF